MMQGMMGDGTAGAMMWGMGLFGVFVIIVRTREVHLFRPVNGSTPAARGLHPAVDNQFNRATTAKRLISPLMYACKKAS